VEEQPGAFRRREVKLGETSEDKVEIVAGLRPGERLVTDGALLLEELSE
jgi:multidrug efflux pump subunit AcrA (membrane-fusion protein)